MKRLQLKPHRLQSNTMVILVNPMKTSVVLMWYAELQASYLGTQCYCRKHTWKAQLNMLLKRSCQGEYRVSNSNWSLVVQRLLLRVDKSYFASSWWGRFATQLWHPQGSTCELFELIHLVVDSMEIKFSTHFPKAKPIRQVFSINQSINHEPLSSLLSFSLQVVS